MTQPDQQTDLKVRVNVSGCIVCCDKDHNVVKSIPFSVGVPLEQLQQPKEAVSGLDRQ